MPKGYYIVNGGERVTAEGAISAYNVVMAGTDKNVMGGTQVKVVTAVTDPCLGAVQSADDLADGDETLLHTQHPDRPLVKLGGTVNRGDLLTSAAGTATAAADGNYYFGEACDYGVSGDIIAYIPRRGYLETT
jgi:hypothetical protein